jgi:thiol:disulfide interchange protein
MPVLGREKTVEIRAGLRNVARMLLRAFAFFALTAALAFAEPEYPTQGPDIYDTKADGFQQIDAALQRAGANHKRVLVMFGANWCVWCHRLHGTFANDQAVAAALRENYELVLVDVNTRHGTKRNAAVNERYGNPVKEGLPVLVVLDASGRPLTTQETGALEDGKSAHDPQKVLAFLERWKPKRS